MSSKVRYLEYAYKEASESSKLTFDEVIDSVFSSYYGYVGHTYPLDVVNTIDGAELQTKAVA